MDDLKKKLEQEKINRKVEEQLEKEKKDRGRNEQDARDSKAMVNIEKFRFNWGNICMII